MSVKPREDHYCAFFVVIAVAFLGGRSNGEEVAFQLTMPGLEEEPFYRGILLLALDQAFTGKKRFLSVDWGWGAVLSCFSFGMTHTFGFSHGSFSSDPYDDGADGDPIIHRRLAALADGKAAAPDPAA